MGLNSRSEAEYHIWAIILQHGFKGPIKTPKNMGVVIRTQLYALEVLDGAQFRLILKFIQWKVFQQGDSSIIVGVMIMINADAG